MIQLWIILRGKHCQHLQQILEVLPSFETQCSSSIQNQLTSSNTSYLNYEKEISTFKISLDFFILFSRRSSQLSFSGLQLYFGTYANHLFFVMTGVNPIIVMFLRIAHLILYLAQVYFTIRDRELNGAGMNFGCTPLCQ